MSEKNHQTIEHALISIHTDASDIAWQVTEIESALASQNLSYKAASAVSKALEEINRLAYEVQDSQRYARDWVDSMRSNGAPVNTHLDPEYAAKLRESMSNEQ